MIDFLKKGKELNNIHVGVSIEHVYNILGEPDEVIGDKKNGYLHYQENRYGYDEKGKVIEMSIEFTRLKVKYDFHNLESEHYGISIQKSFSINTKTKIHKFIAFLNFLQLDWEANSKLDKDYLTIKISSGAYILFDLHDGKSYRISVVDGYQ